MLEKPVTVPWKRIRLNKRRKELRLLSCLWTTAGRPTGAIGPPRLLRQMAHRAANNQRGTVRQLARLAYRSIGWAWPPGCAGELGGPSGCGVRAATRMAKAPRAVEFEYEA
jgi:hypothetical protein